MKCSSPPFLSFLCTNASPTLSFLMAELLLSHIYASREITGQSIEGAESVQSFKWKHLKAVLFSAAMRLKLLNCIIHSFFLCEGHAKNEKDLEAQAEK